MKDFWRRRWEDMRRFLPYWLGFLVAMLLAQWMGLATFHGPSEYSVGERRNLVEGGDR